MKSNLGNKMTTRVLVMPSYVNELVKMPLVRLGLNPSDAENDIVTCPLRFENGTKLSLVIICAAEKGWFREKPVVWVSVAELDSNTRASKVYSRDSITYPSSPNDVLFTHKLSVKVRATVWSLVAIPEVGRCIDIQGPPGHW